MLASCGEKYWLWDLGGVFEIFDQSLLKLLSLCFNMCVWLRDRDLSLICKNKPSGGKSDTNMPNPVWGNWSSICTFWEWYCTSSCF